MKDSPDADNELDATPYDRRSQQLEGFTEGNLDTTDNEVGCSMSPGVQTRPATILEHKPTSEQRRCSRVVSPEGGSLTELVVKEATRNGSPPCQSTPRTLGDAGAETLLSNSNSYSMKDIRNYFESINIKQETVVENFRQFLTESVITQILELDVIVVEITPPVTNNIISTTHSSTNSHSSYTKSRGSSSNSNYISRKSSHTDHRKRHGEYDENRTTNRHVNNSNSNAEDWNSGKSFKVTKTMTKEGVEKDINDIRISLNKISSKNYETHRDLIVLLVGKFMEEANIPHSPPCQSTEEDPNAIMNIKKIAQFIFDIASTNKFYGDIYADLYKELVEKFEIFSTILKDFVSNYNNNIYTLQYVDSNVDYDAYCEYNKANETRRATAAFLVLLMNRSILKTYTLVDLIIHFQSVFTKYISEENRTNEADEITEVLFLLITLGAEILSTLPEWESTIIPNIIITSKLKAKEQKSMSSRSVFKYMDLLKKIGR